MVVPMYDRQAWLKQLWAPILAVLLLIAAAVLPKVESEARLCVALSVGPGTEPLIQAGELGILPADQFQVVELPWTSAVARALGNGAADVGVVTLDGLLRMREGGQKVRVLMVLDESVGADAVMAPEGSADMKGLRGRKIGVDVRSAGAYLLVNALESVGMTMADIQPVQLIESEMEAAVRDGRVHAVVVADPWLSRLSAQGLQVIYDSTRLEVPIMRLLVASERSHEVYRERLGALLLAQKKMSQRNRGEMGAEAVQNLLRRERLTREQFEAALGRVRPLAAQANEALLEGSRAKLEEMADQVEAQMLRHGLLSQRANDAAWIDKKLFKEVSR